MSYHLNKSTGEPEFCRSVYSCGSGTPQDHYGSISEYVREKNLASSVVVVVIPQPAQTV